MINSALTQAYKQVVLDNRLYDTGALHASIQVDTLMSGNQLTITVTAVDYLKYHQVVQVQAVVQVQVDLLEQVVHPEAQAQVVLQAQAAHQEVVALQDLLVRPVAQDLLVHQVPLE